METLYQEPYFYAVVRDEQTNEYFLEVLCGTSTVYELRVKLRKREINDFLRDESALQFLANRVIDAPDKYIYRKY